VAAALGLGAAAGIALQLAVGGAATGSGSDSGRVAALAVVVALAGPAWLAVRMALDRRPARAKPGEVADRRPARAKAGEVADRPRRLAAAAAVLAVAVVAGSLAFGAQAGRGAGAAAGFLHGRDSTWGAALDTFRDRPFAGAGADAFLAGSAQHQGGQTILFAHSLPLELAAELGIAGLVLALALYATSARMIWRARQTSAGLMLGPAAAAFLVASLVDWPWHLAGAGAAWAIAAGGLAEAGTRSETRLPPPGHASTPAVDKNA
jgi:O-antigen ligase